MANFLTWIMGLLGVVLLIKAIVGSIAGGMKRAQAGVRRSRSRKLRVASRPQAQL